MCSLAKIYGNVHEWVRWEWGKGPRAIVHLIEQYVNRSNSPNNVGCGVEKLKSDIHIILNFISFCEESLWLSRFLPGWPVRNEKTRKSDTSELAALNSLFSRNFYTLPTRQGGLDSAWDDTIASIFKQRCIYIYIYIKPCKRRRSF